MNDKEFNKYLGIANHDIQVANNHEELKSYVASILFELDNLQSNWNSLRELIDDEKTRLAKECSHTYEDSLGKTKYVNEDIFNELDKILDKMNDLEKSDNK